MKVALLGAAGGIGQALSLLLKSQMPAHSVLSLYDVAPVTPGIAVDLSHIPTAVTVNGYGGNDPTPALQDANIVIIAAGVARKPGMDRADLLDVNASIIRTLIQHVAKTCPQACIGIITNPVNSMVPIAAQVLRQAKVYNQRKLLGITTLDIIRANTFLAALKQQSPQQVAVPVIGGHSGITILPLLSHIKDIPLDQQQVATLTERIQNAGTEVVNAKAGHGSATLSMGYAAAHFTLALIEALQGQSGVETYAFVETIDQKYSRFFAQPLRLGREGIAEYLAIGALSGFEQQALEGMLHTLQQEITQGEQWIAHKSS